MIYIFLILVSIVSVLKISLEIYSSYRCIKPKEIEKFWRKELNDKEKSRFIRHLGKCSTCEKAFNNIK